MSLEQELHEQWAADAALIALVPAARVFTGFAVGDPTLPYVVLDDVSRAAQLRASTAGAVDRVELCFQIYTDDLDEAKAIAEAVRQQFDRTSFALSSGTVLSMREAESAERLHDSGVWQLSTKYSALIEFS
jgi:hypothetical protein